jgi:signal peptidase
VGKNMKQDNYILKISYKARCFLLIILMTALYMMDIPAIASLMSGYIFNYILKPVLWLGLIFIVYIFPKVHSKGKLRLKSFINWWAFNFAIIFIAASVVGGFLNGFGKSPYSHTLKGMALNILLVGSAVMGREIIRSYLVNSLCKNENYIIFILVSLFFAIASISFSSFFKFNRFQDVVKFSAQYFAPEFSKSLLATYLAFLGGAVPSIIYIGTIEAVNWLSPILPNLRWITTAFIGVLCPMFSFITLQSMYIQESRQKVISDEKEESVFGWIITTVASIGIIWFSVGVFPIYPSVIATGSMEPTIKPGDVILVKKNIDRMKLNIGDVIQFKSDNVLISHRIIENLEVDGERSYKTKGDNNSIIDSKFVKPEQVRGTIVKIVPKIGWPTLLLKSRNDVPLEKVQF